VRTKAFTLIEILVATSILLLLAGLVFFGSRYAIESSRERQTRATLTSLSSMLKEVESKGGRDKIESIYRFQFGSLNADPKSINAPEGAISGIPANTLYNWPGLITTQKVMGVLSSIPANATRINATPPDQRLRADGSATTPLYMQYLGTWSDKANFTPPILLDAWGNPIIYVPGEFYFLNQSNTRVRMMPGLAEVLFKTHGAVEKHRIASNGFNETQNEQTSTPPKLGSIGFFASAGPDGNFQTGEDNIYSFEN
jgi:prepilin-type N-terminal cleavage/methylation domain-containing protein